MQTFDKVLTSEKKLRELAQTCSLIFQNALNLEYCQTKQITFAFLSALAISEKMISLFDLIWKSWRIENKSKISIVPFKNKSKVIHSWCKRSQQRSSITRWIYYLMIVLIVKILSVDGNSKKTCFNYFSRLCLKKWNWRGYTESDEGTQNLTSAQPFWHSLSLQYQLWHYVKVKGISSLVSFLKLHIAPRCQ